MATKLVLIIASVQCVILVFPLSEVSKPPHASVRGAWSKLQTHVMYKSHSLDLSIIEGT